LYSAKSAEPVLEVSFFDISKPLSVVLEGRALSAKEELYKVDLSAKEELYKVDLSIHCFQHVLPLPTTPFEW
jgi:hypothetical protein